MMRWPEPGPASEDNSFSFEGQRLTVPITLQKKEIFLKLPEEFGYRTKTEVAVTREEETKTGRSGVH